jgi:ankyrin repeat protein
VRANPKDASVNGYTPLAELACLTRKYITGELYVRSYDPEHKAHAENVRCQIAQYLIEAGDDVNATSPDGNSVIAHALRLGLGNSANLPIDFIVLLINHGLDLNALYYTGQPIRNVLQELAIPAIDASLADAAREDLKRGRKARKEKERQARAAAQQAQQQKAAEQAPAEPVAQKQSEQKAEQVSLAQKPSFASVAALLPTAQIAGKKQRKQGAPQKNPGGAGMQVGSSGQKLDKKIDDFEALVAQFQSLDAKKVTAAIQAPAPVAAAAFEPIAQPYNYVRALAVLRGVITLSELDAKERTADPAKVEAALKYFQPETDFFRAVLARDYDSLSSILSSKPDCINDITRQGDTALHIAASLTDVTLCQFLCDHGASVHAQNVLNETPLHKIFDISPTTGEVREAATFQFLRSRGAAIDAVDTCGVSVLHCAVLNTFCAITDYLCATLPSEALRAQTLQKINFCTGDARFCRVMMYERSLRPLDFSLHVRKPTPRSKYIFNLIMRRLIADDVLQMLPPDKADSQAIRTLFKRKFDEHVAGPCQKTLDELYEIAYKNFNVKFSCADNVEIINPLYAAAVIEDLAQLRTICQTSPQAKRMVNMPYTKDAISALQRAVARFDVDAVELLLQAGADANYAMPQGGFLMAGMTAMHIVASGGIENITPKELDEDEKILAIKRIIALLVTHGADVNAMTANVFDPLSCAIQSPLFTVKEKIAVINCLVSHKASLTTIYPGNHTILHLAALLPKQCVLVVQELCEIIGKNNPHYAHVYDGAPGIAGTAMGVAAKISNWPAMLCLFDYAGVSTYVADPSQWRLINSQRVLLDEQHLPEAEMIKRLVKFLELLESTSPECAISDPASATTATVDAIDWDAMFLPHEPSAAASTSTLDAEDAYMTLDIPALEKFVRDAPCKTVTDFIELIKASMAVDYLRTETYKRKWQLLLSAPTPAARRYALEALCHTLHSFRKSI